MEEKPADNRRMVVAPFGASNWVATLKGDGLFTVRDVMAAQRAILLSFRRWDLKRRRGAAAVASREQSEGASNDAE